MKRKATIGYVAAVLGLGAVGVIPKLAPTAPVVSQISTPAQSIPGEVPPSSTTTSPVVGLVSINSASQAELESLPRIGPKLAQKIIEGRPYQTIQELDRVKGIGSKMLEKLGPLISL